MDILKNYYWSKSDAFLLPLTGLQKEGKYKITSYLFWDDYSIEDYQLVLKMEYTDKEDFINYCKRHIFPILNRNAYLLEAHDFEGGSIYVLDISDWKTDIEWFLKGKYSKLSPIAKEMIKKYHTYYKKDDIARLSPILQVYLVAALYPTEKREDFGGKTPLQKIAKDYDLDIKELNRIGEAAGIYEVKEETLNVKVTENKD